MSRHYRSLLVTAAQVGLLTLIAMAGNWISGHFHWKVPGNVVGLLILFLLLQARVVRLEWVQAGANWLLAELMLFFVPSVVGITQYKQVLASAGLRILFVIAASTLLVMVSAGLAAQYLAKNVEEQTGDGEVAEHR